MTLVRFQPEANLYRLQRSMNHLFDSVFTPHAQEEDSCCDWMPAVDIHETPDSIVLRADLPGMNKDEVKVVVHEHTLTLKGERKSEKKEEQANYYRMERVSGSFYRSFSLPSIVDAGRIKAAYTNGVLEIVLPKAEEAKPKEIAIDVK